MERKKNSYGTVVGADAGWVDEVSFASASSVALAEALDGLPPEKMHCSMLAEEGIRAAIEDFQKK